MIEIMLEILTYVKVTCRLLIINSNYIATLSNIVTNCCSDPCTDEIDITRKFQTLRSSYEDTDLRKSSNSSSANKIQNPRFEKSLRRFLERTKPSPLPHPLPDKTHLFLSGKSTTQLRTTTSYRRRTVLLRVTERLSSLNETSLKKLNARRIEISSHKSATRLADVEATFKTHSCSHRSTVVDRWWSTVLSALVIVNRPSVYPGTRVLALKGDTREQRGPTWSRTDCQLRPATPRAVAYTLDLANVYLRDVTVPRQIVAISANFLH